MKDTQVDHSMCAAYGCPCAATASTGGANWYCTYHFGTEATNWARITLELKRLEWLLIVCRGIRAWYGTARWEKVYRMIRHDIRLNQRGDLLFKPELDGSVSNWLRRLETYIDHSARGALQPSLPVTPQQQATQDPMQRVQFAVPQAA